MDRVVREGEGELRLYRSLMAFVLYCGLWKKMSEVNISLGARAPVQARKVPATIRRV